jgi:RHS repeat-associated protein
VDGLGAGYLSSADDYNPKFTGQMRDQETALDWFNVRHMSGAQGRFQSADPGNAGADVGDPQTWNMYSYVGNNPLSYTDPSGESFWSVLGGIFSGLGAFLATGNPVLGAEVGLGVDNTIDSIQNGQFPSAGLLGLAGAAGGGVLGSAIGSANTGPWSEEIPGLGSGSINPGGVFGSGNTDPFVFNAQGGSSSTSSFAADPLGATLQALGTFSSGAADFLTFGLTKKINEWDGGASSINYNSKIYTAGKVTGISLTAVSAVAGGITAAAVANGKNGAYFGRGTASVFNTGKFRFGWYWEINRDAIGLRIGAARGTSWYSHIPFWYPK